ncbi:Uncharacterised protein [uncultured archaeon]|nr:Uncharacterised protein [uncultured archaeon]
MDLKRQWINEIWSNKYLILISLIFLLIAVILDLTAGNYVTRTPAVAASDLVLDHIPVVDLDFFYVYGIITVIAVLFLYPLFFKVNNFHKVIAQFSLLVMIRSIFICFTHLALPTDALDFHVPQIFSYFNFKNDLFFSGHAAIPFLGFLLFPEKKIRYFFLFFSILLSGVVLLMHVHYTIDVLSAFFITFGTFKIGEWFFNKISRYNGHK